MRSKEYLDVSEICAGMGGGGHRHAAGCTLHCTLPEAIPRVKDAVEKALSAFQAENPGLLKSPEE